MQPRFIGLSVCGSRSQAKDHSEKRKNGATVRAPGVIPHTSVEVREYLVDVTAELAGHGVQHSVDRRDGRAVEQLGAGHNVCERPRPWGARSGVSQRVRAGVDGAVAALVGGGG